MRAAPAAKPQNLGERGDRDTDDWSHIPATMRHFAPTVVGPGSGKELADAPDRPDRSLRASRSARGSCPTAAKKSGKRPQASPSLRLLTKPAWAVEERSGSVKLVRVKTSVCDRLASILEVVGVVFGLVEVGVALGLADHQDRQGQARSRRTPRPGRTARGAIPTPRRPTRWPARHQATAK